MNKEKSNMVFYLNRRFGLRKEVLETLDLEALYIVDMELTRQDILKDKIVNSSLTLADTLNAMTEELTTTGEVTESANNEYQDALNVFYAAIQELKSNMN